MAETSPQMIEATDQSVPVMSGTLDSHQIKREYLSHMSHELRTPLNAIIGFADLLRLGMVPQDSPKHREFAGHIAASGRNLLQVVNSLLGLSNSAASEPVAHFKHEQQVTSTLQETTHPGPGTNMSDLMS